MKIQIILGSTRQERQGDKVAAWITDLAKQQKDFEVEFIDLREVSLPMFNETKSPMGNEGKWDSPEGAAWAKKVGEADGYILVTPEYNHSYPAVLKNALDYAFYEWNHKPFGFVSYSPVNTGAVRAIEHLATVIGQLKGVAITATYDSVIIPNLKIEGDKFDGKDYEGMAAGLFTQLKWWGNATKAAREADAKK